MSDESFEAFVQGQFPFRPSHPDFTRLQEGLMLVEQWRKTGVDVNEKYSEFADLHSLVYMATGRAHLEVRDRHRDLPPELQRRLVEAMANAWVEGALFGIVFERAGGTTKEDGPDTPPSG